ncbi:hypothetical protein [Aneurinibacillus sp. REN35]
MSAKLETLIENLNTLSDEQERKHQAMHLLVAAIMEQPAEQPVQQ